MQLRKRSQVIMTLALLVTMSGCAKSVPNPVAQTPIQKVSEGLVIFAKGIGTVQTSIIAAQKAGLADQGTTRMILDSAQQCNYVGQQASSIARQASTLDGTTSQKLLMLLNPLSNSLQLLEAQGVGNIKDKATKDAIAAAITTLQSVISTIQLSISLGGA